MKPKNKPKIESSLPSPANFIVLLIPLFTTNITNITKIKIAKPSVTSSTYSLSIIFLKYGLILGNKIIVTT